MSGNAESGSTRAGVPVVRLGARRYELDEAALRRVLLRQDVQDLPVVVLSVAGAYRGGKSFILDFFLRYLNATVAVLLMDTQGTFDSETTLGQNSTIFALSTLVSSVQIYNLSGNIREDDLQHLQLFTEYGKLACKAKSKAFQTLLFLVRDWMFAYEHAYGFDGGKTVLTKRLQSNPSQNAELREVREHINSSFEQIKCFLMPHPGLSVSNKSFSGCIRDLTEDFRSALLKLVPSVFDPENLTPKLINGERVRTQDMFEYFQQYVNIFNSDELPKAVTIFKATADACLQAAARAARREYEVRMKERVGGARSMPERALRAAHGTARADAAQTYAQKGKLGPQEDADARLKDLLKELDESLSRYLLENEAKVRESMSLAKRTYQSRVSSVCGEHARLCLPPCDLRELHAEARQAALTLFDAARDVPKDEKDDQRPELEQILEQKYERLCAFNDQNNKSAMQAARDLYMSRMRELEQAGASVSSEKLEAENRRALDEAKAFLKTQRNRPTSHDDDPFLKQLLQVRCPIVAVAQTAAATTAAVADTTVATLAAAHVVADSVATTAKVTNRVLKVTERKVRREIKRFGRKLRF